MEQPAKRKRRSDMALFVVCFAITVVILVYGLKKDEIINEYNAKNDLSRTFLEGIINGTIRCHIETEERNDSVLLYFGLELFAIIFGCFLYCLFLVVEEIYHFRSRYNSDIMRLWQACFSGISWTAVTVAAAVFVLFITLATTFENGTYELIYLVIAIGLSPLLTHLLIIHTKSEVYVSTVLEENEANVGQILAWSYYYDYLREALSTFQLRVSEQASTNQGENLSLSLNKLILLIPHDCTSTENLENQDSKITKLGEIFEGNYQFPVYRLRWNGKEYRYAIKYAKKPLETLYQISKHANRSLARRKNELEYQVKFLYGTLSQILMSPLDVECRDKCILVPIAVKSVKNLQNGGLVNAIMTMVIANNPQCFESDSLIKSTPHKPEALEHEESISGSLKICSHNFEEHKNKNYSNDSQKPGFHDVEEVKLKYNDKDFLRMGSDELKAIERKHKSKEKTSQLDVIEVDV